MWHQGHFWGISMYSPHSALSLYTIYAETHIGFQAILLYSILDVKGYIMYIHSDTTVSQNMLLKKIIITMDFF